MKALRLIFSSDDHRVLDDTIQSVIDLIKKDGLDIIGPVPLPTTKERFGDALRKYVTHKRMMDIVGITPKILADIQQYQIPIGVNVSFKQVEL